MLSNCRNCDLAICECGYAYRNWDKTKRIEQAAVILGIKVPLLVWLIADITPDQHPEQKKEEDERNKKEKNAGGTSSGT